MSHLNASPEIPPQELPPLTGAQASALNAHDERTVLAAVGAGFRHYADIRRATGLTSARMVAAVERCVSNFSLQRRDGLDLRDEHYLEGEACPPVRQVGCSRW